MVQRTQRSRTRVTGVRWRASEIFDFKCAASRTCSAWVAKEEGEEEEGEEGEEGEEEYEGKANAQMEGEDYES